MSELGDLGILLKVLDAWRRFRAGHDLDGIKMTCCDNSKHLWEALDEFETLFTKPNQEVNR